MVDLEETTDSSVTPPSSNYLLLLISPEDCREWNEYLSVLHRRQLPGSMPQSTWQVMLAVGPSLSSGAAGAQEEGWCAPSICHAATDLLLEGSSGSAGPFPARSCTGLGTGSTRVHGFDFFTKTFQVKEELKKSPKYSRRTCGPSDLTLTHFPGCSSVGLVELLPLCKQGAQLSLSP